MEEDSIEALKGLPEVRSCLLLFLSLSNALMFPSPRSAFQLPVGIWPKLDQRGYSAGRVFHYVKERILSRICLEGKKVKKRGKIVGSLRGLSSGSYSNSEEGSSSPPGGFGGPPGGPLGLPAAMTSSIFKIIVAASVADFTACSFTTTGS